MNLPKKAIIIGSGIAGIAVSIRLRKLGFEVDVFESHSTFGGKLAEYRYQDYRFDCGPSLFTLPELVTELFELCEKKTEQCFQYHTLDTVTRYFYSDGIVINSYTKAEKFAQEAHQKVGLEQDKIITFLKKQSKTYHLLAPLFIENPIHKFLRLFKWKNIPALIHVSHPRFLKTLNGVNKPYFNNDYITKIFNRYGTYNGSNPYKMPSLFNIISHLEHNVGAYLPEKGMRSIVEVLYQLAVDEGVRFNFNTKVDEIVIEKNIAKGVLVQNQMFYADFVVSNMDINLTYQKLLPKIKAPSVFLENEKSTSALIFHWAMNKRFETIDVHNILFADNYEEEFDFLFRKIELYHDPTVYIYVSSKLVKHDAPAGGENWFVMVNMPHLSTHESNFDKTNQMKEVIIRKINRFLNVNIESSIIHEHVITPTDLAKDTNAYLGSLYGASSNSLLSAFVRHPNFSFQIPNLFFCGGTVHPGGGVPLCLLSAKITAQLIEEKL